MNWYRISQEIQKEYQATPIPATPNRGPRKPIDTVEEPIEIALTPDPVKIMYILRGISGSGKSHISKDLVRNGVIISTDDYFMVNGIYKFDYDKVSDAQAWSQVEAFKAMQANVSPIVIDDTNIEAWEMKPYIAGAQIYRYRIEIVETETPWRFDAEELVKRNRHGVHKEIIEDMIDRYESNVDVKDIVESEVPEYGVLVDPQTLQRYH